MISLKVAISTQELFIFEHNQLIKKYLISTGKNGVGEVMGSEKTPRGWHIIRAKIGGNCPENTVFRGRRPTGEIYSKELKKTHPERDWILTRILWLCGMEVGKNRLKNIDTQRRYIYIHGAPDEAKMGVPGSKGCIRMRNQDIIELFELVPYASKLLIQE